MVITETRRDDSTWIAESEVTDRYALSDELADFCAQYPIYHMKESQKTLLSEATRVRTEGGGIMIEVTAFSSFIQLNSNSCYA